MNVTMIKSEKIQINTTTSVKLRTNGIENPVGVDCKNIRISCIPDFFECKKEIYTKFKLIAASSPGLLAKPDVIDYSDFSIESAYILRDMHPFMPVYMHLKSWNSKKITACGYFVTAPDKMAGADWIGGSGYYFLRKDFYIDKCARHFQGFLFVLAEPHTYARETWMDDHPGKRTMLLGNSFIKYKVWVNGELVGLGPFRSITNGKSVLHGFDVSSFIKSGKNIISILGIGQKKGIAAAMRIYSDGECIHSLGSDSSWKKINGNEIIRPVCWERQNIDNYFKGGPGPGELSEHINGKLFPFGWEKISFNDQKWFSAETYGAADEDFELASAQNYCTELILPEEIKKTENKSFFIDFGREVVGSIRLNSKAENDDVEVRLGEELLSPGKVKFQLRTGNCYQEIWNFDKNKDAELEQFGIRAFRYAELHNWRKSLTNKSVSVRRISYPFDDNAATFKSSNPSLNKIWDFCKYSIKATNMDLYIDCPTRERVAYEADAYINMLSHFYLDNDYALASRTGQYFIEHSTYPLEWKLFIAPIFYGTYMQSGDIRPIKKYYKTIVRQYSFLNKFEDGLRRDFPHEIIVDWPQNMRDNYEFGDFNTVANAFLYWESQVLTHMALSIGKQNDAEEFARISSMLKEAFNRRLFNKQTGHYVDCENSKHSSLHANMFALRFGLALTENVQSCIDFIVAKGMSCGVYPAQFLLETLFKYGKAENAISLLTAEKGNCWMSMINSGATICTEVWNSSDKSNASLAHPWSSSPANIIPRYLFGIRPLSPGWKTYSFAPSAESLDWAEIKIPTPRGPIYASFEWKFGKLKTSLSGPYGVSC